MHERDRGVPVPESSRRFPREEPLNRAMNIRSRGAGRPSLPGFCDAVISRGRFTPVVSSLLLFCCRLRGCPARRPWSRAPRPQHRDHAWRSAATPRTATSVSAGRERPSTPRSISRATAKRWTLALTRSEDGAVYEVSRGNVETMMSALACRLLLPDQEVALSRQQLWAAWSNPTQGAGAPQVLVGQVVDIIDGQHDPREPGPTLRDRALHRDHTSREPRRPPTATPSPGEAVEANRQLVSRQQVRIELDTQERDRDGRLLAYVYVADQMVNAELVRRGSAGVMTVQPNVRHRDLFVTLEQEARDNRRGVWADPAEATTPTTVEPALARWPRAVAAWRLKARGRVPRSSRSRASRPPTRGADGASTTCRTASSTARRRPSAATRRSKRRGRMCVASRR